MISEQHCSDKYAVPGMVKKIGVQRLVQCEISNDNAEADKFIEELFLRPQQNANGWCYSILIGSWQNINRYHYVELELVYLYVQTREVRYLHFNDDGLTEKVVPLEEFRLNLYKIMSYELI